MTCECSNDGAAQLAYCLLRAAKVLLAALVSLLTILRMLGYLPGG